MSVKQSLSGTYAALLTGFADDGSLDERRQNNIIDYVAGQDIAGIYVGGSSGEEGLMETDELLEQQKIVAAHRRPENLRMIAHVGRPNLRAAIILAKQAESLGYDALAALPPHSYPFTDSEILSYYTTLTKATDLPMIVYEIPSRTKQAIPLATLDKIFALDNVVGIKFTSTDLFKLSMLQASHPDKLFFYGYDEIVSSAAMLNVDGGIGTTYNILGGLYTALFKAVAKQDLNTVRTLQKISQEFVKDLMVIGLIPGIKLTMQSIGVDCGPPRAPFMLLTKDADALIQTAVLRLQQTGWLTPA